MRCWPAVSSSEVRATLDATSLPSTEMLPCDAPEIVIVTKPTFTTGLISTGLVSTGLVSIGLVSTGAGAALPAGCGGTGAGTGFAGSGGDADAAAAGASGERPSMTNAVM